MSIPDPDLTGLEVDFQTTNAKYTHFTFQRLIYSVHFTLAVCELLFANFLHSYLHCNTMHCPLLDNRWSARSTAEPINYVSFYVTEAVKKISIFLGIIPKLVDSTPSIYIGIKM